MVMGVSSFLGRTIDPCRHGKLILAVVVALCAGLATPQRVAAQEATAQPTAAASNPALVAGNTAWMLTSSALVLFMTAPALAMFYGGLVRKKNVLSVLMQCVFLMGLMTVIWGTYGYSLAFGGSDAYIGNGEYLFLNGVQG